MCLSPEAVERDPFTWESESDETLGGHSSLLIGTF